MSDEPDDAVTAAAFCAYWDALGPYYCGSSNGERKAFTAGWEAGAARAAADERAKLDAVYEWLVEENYPFDWHGDKPAWLDLRKLAETWNAKDTETPEIWLEGILAETGWDE